ncbi:peroxiredoxin [Candidatus Vampirococcus lugosii]|uniref:Alkyl hydroperoxide reductase n=1 Tax=Candidatus Vampirococcus lugosii TaxID=2789015 RepID=A0ABS5QK40_9BACT|nr:peroxiredoxin [Candidatus Vampirococcus lugosii]MBS8121597.1 alkyl hydroperoxide reductase [Candidatus Vampirococcus lugosii]
MEEKNMMLEELNYNVSTNYPVIKIEEEVLDFDLELYDPIKDDVVNKKISDYRGKWLAIVFYPADFTFVCPTELKDLNNYFEEFKNLENVEVIGASTDTVFSHKGWIENEKLFEDFKLSLLSDRKTLISRYFGILNEKSGNSERGTFIIDPNGVLKSIEVSTEPVGRSAKELLRRLKALKFTNENPGNACPANWIEDAPVLKPSVKIAGHVGENLK